MSFSGYLYRKDAADAEWRRQYFDFKGFKITVMKEYGSEQIVDNIDLTKLESIDPSDDRMQQPHSFVMDLNPNKTIYLAADGADVKKRVLSAIYLNWDFARKPTYEGYLYKEGGNFKTWKKRYFKLRGTNLFYYKDKEEKEPLDSIPIRGCPVELFEKKKKENCIRVITQYQNHRTYYLAADSSTEVNEWFNHLLGASGYKPTADVHIREEAEELHNGYLKKKGAGVMSGWSRRYFVLTTESLRYWEKTDEIEPKGELRLIGCQMGAVDEEKLIFNVKSSEKGREIQLQAETKDEFNVWVEKLKKAIGDVQDSFQRAKNYWVNSTMSIYFFQWKKVLEYAGTVEFDFGDYNFQLHELLRESERKENTIKFIMEGNPSQTLTLQIGSPTPMTSTMFRQEFAQLKRVTESIASEGFTEKEGPEIFISRELQRTRYAPIDFAVWDCWMAVARSEKKERAVAVCRRKHIPPLGTEFMDFVFIGTKALQAQTQAPTVNIDKSPKEKVNSEDEVTEEIVEESDKKPLLEKSEEGKTEEKEEATKEKVPPADESKDVSMLAKDASAHAVVEFAAKTFGLSRECSEPDYEEARVRDILKQMYCEERYYAWNAAFFDRHPPVKNAGQDICQYAHECIAGEPYSKNLYNIVETAADVVTRSLGGVGEKPTLSKGSVNLEDVNVGVDNEEKFTHEHWAKNKAGVPWSRENIDPETASILDPAETFQQRTARYLTHCIDGGNEDELNLERIVRVTRSKRAPQKFKNRAHGLLEYCVFLCDEERTWLSSKNNVEAEGTSHEKELGYNPSLRNKLIELIEGEGDFYVNDWATSRLLSVGYLRRVVSRIPQEKNEENEDADKGKGKEEVATEKERGNEKENSSQQPLEGVEGESDSEDEDEGDVEEETYIKLLCILLRNKRLVSVDLRLEVVVQLGLYVKSKEQVDIVQKMKATPVLLNLFKLNDSLIQIAVARTLTNMASCTHDKFQSAIIFNREAFGILKEWLLSPWGYKVELSSLVLCNCMDTAECLRKEIDSGLIGVLGKALAKYMNAVSYPNEAVLTAVINTIWNIGKANTARKTILNSDIFNNLSYLLMNSTSELVLEKVCGAFMVLGAADKEACAKIGADGRWGAIMVLCKQAKNREFFKKNPRTETAIARMKRYRRDPHTLAFGSKIHKLLK